MSEAASQNMELLAPAGDEEALEAAIASGANAIYLELHTLNARRGARNFAAEDLPRIVSSAHQRSVRIFLAFDIDITQRELGQAVRILKLAADAGVDAVLVRDPAMIHLRPHFPSIEYHFSGKSSIANSEDVLAAGELGANRVVLALELSLPEIKSCSDAGNVAVIGTPLSMKDLAAVRRISELSAAGVKSLKIEGPLKSARWVGPAVGLFADVLKGGEPQALLDRATQLATKSSAKKAPAARPEEPQRDSYDLTIDVTDKGIVCTCKLDGREFSWTLPKTVVHRARKAVYIRKAIEWLKMMPIREYQLGEARTNSPDFLMVPRAANALPDQISNAIRQLTKPEDETLRLDLPEDLRSVLAKPERHAANKLHLGDPADRVRLEARHLGEFVRRVKATGRADAVPSAIIIEHASADQIERLLQSAGGIPLVIALPPVFFQADITNIHQVVAHALANDIPVEVNTWGGWKIARSAGARIEAGPALGVMNSLAATMLTARGCESVSIAPELERKQFEDVTAICPAPCNVTVFGRPALMVTRVKMDLDQVANKALRESRGIELHARQEHGLWALRPAAPFDLRAIRNKGISAAHLVVDLVASPSPADEWLHRPAPPAPGERPLHFNYGRTLA